jgi:hypothetical protein
VDEQGGPLGVVVAGANVHDTKLLEGTIEAIVVERPPERQHLCLDKGYDNPTGHEATTHAGYQPHIRPIGEEKLAKRTDATRHDAGSSSVPSAGSPSAVPFWFAMTSMHATISA